RRGFPHQIFQLHLPPGAGGTSARKWESSSLANIVSSASAIIAFSSKVDAGSREENASKQKFRASVLIQSEPKGSSSDALRFFLNRAGLSGASTVRDFGLRNGKLRHNSVGKPDIEQHCFGLLARHHAHGQIDHEKRLLAFQFGLRVRALLL